MTEAKITCLCPSIRIEDLGLQLVKGQVEFVDAEIALRSDDLRAVHRAYGVQVQYVRRYQERRGVGEIPVAPVHIPKPHSLVKDPDPKENPPDMEALARKVVDLLRPHLIEGQERVQDQIRKVHETLQGGVQFVPTEGGVVHRVVPQDPTPMFIPDVQVGGGGEGIVLRTQEAQGGKVEEAMRALKKARQGKS